MKSVLLLNADYTPLNIISIQRAITLLTKDKTYGHPTSKIYKFKTVSKVIEVPAALVLKYFVKIPRRKFAATRRNILQRDSYVCQYCQIDLNNETATLDHVIPKNRGGGNSWTNLVCSCRDCNLSKGNRTPKEAKMELIRKPKEPNIYNFFGDTIGFYTGE